MASYYQTPPRQQSFQSVPGNPSLESNMNLYSDLPSELRSRPASAQSRSRTPYDNTPSNNSGYQSTSVARSVSGPVGRGGQAGRAEPPVSTENLAPIPRAARTLNDYLTQEARYPELDNIVSQGQSADYDQPKSHAWLPFTRTNLHHIPDAIFDQYNQAHCHTMMGLFAEIGQAWMSVDNRLYMWDYATGGGFQGWEDQPNTITAVRLLRPRAGVFVDPINYLLVIGTSAEVIAGCISAMPNHTGRYELTMYESRMAVNTKGLDVSVIEGSPKTGRIFFGGRSDNDIYEFTYQGEEGWFRGKSGKICHTSQGITSFAPKIPIPFLGKPADPEFVVQMVMDDTRNLLYTLSSTSTIRAFHLAQDDRLTLRITHTFSQTLSNIRVMIPTSSLLSQSSSIISLSPVPAQEARRTHIIATTSTGCRLYMSAVSSDFSYDSAPSSMQVVHVRFPPPSMTGTAISLQRESLGQTTSNQSPALTPSRKATVFPPGYFFCFVNKPDQGGDSLFLSAPDSAKMAFVAEQGHGRLQLHETGSWIALESRAEAIEIISPPFAARNTPQGFGNETAVQFDLPPTEVAILTNSGIHIIRRRRLVEIFAAAVRYSSSAAHGVEGEMRKFFDVYGRAEGCATALAVACGASTEVVPEHRGGKINDVEVADLARKFFIEFGGKPRAENIYDAATLPSLDSVRLSGRHEGISLYVSRIVRSIWRTQIISESRSPIGGLTHGSTISKPKLTSIQDQLSRLLKFLEENKSFIDGLAGAETLMRVGSRVEEVAQQAEHRALHALVQLIGAMIEGISFVLVLFEDKVDEIILSLPEHYQQEAKRITYEGLFTSAKGNSLAKELVQAIVNKNISAGSDVDTIAEALRRRCGSFCSADDVIIFKAVEQLRKAANASDPDVKQQNLRESLRLFTQSTSSLTMENLRDTLSEFQKLQFFQGAVQLPLLVAKEKDRGNQALSYIADGKPEYDPRAEYYNQRNECYQLVFAALDAIDNAANNAPQPANGQLSEAAMIRMETWELIYSSDDEAFHYSLYDWLFSRQQAERLLDVNSAYVLPYLRRTAMASDDISHADLLWQYYARRDNYLEAADVLYNLAKSPFQLTLERRLEYLSRARGFCNSHGPISSRQRMNDLSHTIQEELDVAIIQDDVLRKIKEDERISDVKRDLLKSQLDAHLISLSDLYNKFAEPYGYDDVCLAIFQSADYRGPTEIKNCWERLINQIHDKTIREGKIQGFEAVAEKVRTLGQRFSLSEYIFPPNELVPLLETYALEKQRDIGPPTWVVDTLLEAGVQPEVLLRILDDMFWRNEIPFQGPARRKLIRDAVFVAEKWFYASLKGGRGVGGGVSLGFKADMVIEMLANYLQSGHFEPGDRDRLERLLFEMKRRTQM